MSRAGGAESAEQQHREAVQQLKDYCRRFPQLHSVDEAAMEKALQQTDGHAGKAQSYLHLQEYCKDFPQLDEAAMKKALQQTNFALPACQFVCCSAFLIAAPSSCGKSLQYSFRCRYDFALPACPSACCSAFSIAASSTPCISGKRLQ